MSETCPCAAPTHPQAPTNPPGLERVRYRVGDFRDVRRALLQPLPDEQALAAWRPSERGDLVLQTLEWWAYIAEVLGFYTELSLNESLLRTALREESVRRIVRVLGYRPRPALAARADLAALLAAAQVSLPTGFAVDSKPAPGQAPQTFETDAPLTLARPDAVTATPLGHMAGAQGQLYLEGAVADLRPGELLILLPSGAAVTAGTLLGVASVVSGKDPAGRRYTEIAFTGAPPLPTAQAAAYCLLRSRRSVGLWRYPTTTNLVMSGLHLEGLERATRSGDPLVLTAPGNASLTPRLLAATGSTEQVWYANGNAAEPPASAPTPAAAIGIPHSRLSYTPNIPNAAAWDAVRAQVSVLLQWQSAGVLRDAPLAHWDGTQRTLVAAAGTRFRIGDAQTVLIEDAQGQGVKAKADVGAEFPQRLSIRSFDVAPPPLALPLRVLHNVFAVTRGKTVADEVLGSGNALEIDQEFRLAKSPLTYLPAGDGYRSTLRIQVDGIEWTEVPNFLGQGPQARVFVTREDDDGRTHVHFGDGIEGARLPTGRDNLVARYRYGAGAAAPTAGALTAITRPLPGLSRLRAPLAAGGGADADSPERLRRLAPRSVLTFGRAVSADDYEAIAAQAPGVARVKAAYGWNAAQQRATVTLYVGDTPAAADAVRQALALAADPSRPVTVAAAVGVALRLRLALSIACDRLPEEVAPRVRAALLDPDRGLLGARRLGIGEGLYFSQVAAVCLGVSGVVSVTAVRVDLARPDPATGLLTLTPETAARIAAATGELLRVEQDALALDVEVLSRA